MFLKKERTLLFRGKRYDPIKDNDRKEWVCGGVYQNDGNFSIIYTDINASCAVHTDTLCQYSGKDDYTGTPVYEGDILETETGLWVVKYDQGSFLVSCLSYSCLEYLYSLSASYKVIGNVFDDPDIVRRYLP